MIYFGDKMEESIEIYIAQSSLQSNVPILIETYLVSLLEIHPEIISPIEKLFFLEWHFQRMFQVNDDYWIIPQFKNASITGYYKVDFMILGPDNHPLIAIEINGHNFHEKTKEQVRKDKERERFITKNVTKFLRFSGSEVFKNPSKAVNEVLSLIDKIKEDEK